MEITSSHRIQERDNNPSTSPTSNGSSTITSNGSSLIPTPPHTPTPTPTPKTIFRSQEPNPYPTTFVQADTSTFKHVVQMLTGSSQSAKKTDSPPPSRGGSATTTIPPIKSTAQKKQGFKLYERRNSLKNGLMINTLLPGYAQNSTFSPRKHEILSPSILDFPALALSPHTPMKDDGPSKSFVAVEEERAIAEKKFYFHPSPRTTTPRNVEPQLLPLFPVTSPRVSESSA